MTSDAECVFDGSNEDKIFDDRSVRRNSNAPADQNRDVVIHPVLLTSSEWSVYVNLYGKVEQRLSSRKT